jgi:hypothetical protein
MGVTVAWDFTESLPTRLRVCEYDDAACVSFRAIVVIPAWWVVCGLIFPPAVGGCAQKQQVVERY